MISVFDIYKIGVGFLSLYMVGLMKVGKEFIDELCLMGKLCDVIKIIVDVYGLLLLIGKGYYMDIVIIMGLVGNMLEKVDIDLILSFIVCVEEIECFFVGMYCYIVFFFFEGGMNFYCINLFLYENGM